MCACCRQSPAKVYGYFSSSRASLIWVPFCCKPQKGFGQMGQITTRCWTDWANFPGAWLGHIFDGIARPFEMHAVGSEATYYGGRQFAFYPFLLQVTLVFGDSMTKFQLSSYTLIKFLKHPALHLPIRKRVKLVEFSTSLDLLRMWVEFSTNPNMLRMLVETHLLSNRFSEFDTQVTWDVGLFPSSKAQKTLAWPQTGRDQFVSISSQNDDFKSKLKLICGTNF